MLLAMVVISIFPITLSISAADESAFICPTEALEGNWEVFECHWGDSNIWFVHIGELRISGSQYLFKPDPDAFISPRMSQRFGFIQKTEGILWFEYREGVENTGSYQTDVILGTVSFNGGEGFLIRTDLDNGKLCLTSAVSEIELFRICKPLIPEESRDASE